MNVLTGWGGVPPIVVAIARGLLEAVVMAAIGGAIVYVSDAQFPTEYKILVPFGLALLRTLEGAADHIDNAKQRANELK